MKIVFDLDGTLADNEHRQHFLEKTPKDWDGFFEACDGDEPIHNVIAVFRALLNYHGGAEHQIEIWSGRGAGENDSVRLKSITWLQHHVDRSIPSICPEIFFSSPNPVLRMRAHDDHRRDDVLKKTWLDKAREQGSSPDLIFDDRDQVVAMWRREGVQCFQVAPGNF